MAVITFSRQYGSGGDEIAGRVAELLGYRIFDKSLMVKMAAEVGLSEQEIVDFSEADHRSQTFLDRLLGRSTTVGYVRTWTEDIRGVRKPSEIRLTDAQAVTMVRGVIEAAYRNGKVVIVGRGGQAILRGRPDVLHVRVEAPLEHRVARLVARNGLDAMEAERVIEERDRAARDYVMRFYDLDPADSMHYHLVINTGLLDTETAAQVIALAVQQMRPVPQPEPLPRPIPPMIFG